MCGIAGYVGDVQPDLMQRMNATQAHRGPDGEGVWEDASAAAALGHVRLAILDLSDQASQPMHSPDGRFVLSYNGEIYNFQELRHRLVGLGHRFRSTGDTEVLLAGLMQWGDSFIEKLNGIFAFALWDNQQRELLLARDRMGVKPLYYAVPQPGTLLFASECKAMFCHPRMPREPDFIALQQHLAFGHSSGERTAFRGIRRLPLAGILRWKAATMSHQIQRYWHVTVGSDPLTDREGATQQLRQELADATVRQLISDVPGGAFLSGGLDSSLLTIHAARQQPELECYTTTYSARDNRLDQSAADVPYARRLAADHQLALREIEMTSDVAGLLPRLIHHLDEPLADPAVIACYLICKLAREHGTKVLLSGQGADELLAGYPRYQAMHATKWLDALPVSLRRGLAAASGKLPGSFAGPVGAAMRRGRRVLSVADDSPMQRFLHYCTNVPSSEVRSVFHNDVRSILANSNATTECLARMRAGGCAEHDGFLQRDQSVYLPNHNLMYTDKMSMAVGVEVRVPFLDNEVVRLVNRMPYHWKMAGGVTKSVLRTAARGVVPDAIIDRKKAGFGAPYRTWLRRDLEPMWRDLISDAAVRRRGWFDSQALQAARQRSQSGHADLYMLQWAVLAIELWARRFIDSNPAVCESSGASCWVAAA